MSWQVEMVWRCSACGNENRGRDLACAKCGDPKDSRETYEMPADTSEDARVRDAALLRTAEGGPNWRCSFCGGDQRAADGSCARCGAGRVAGAAAEGPDIFALRQHSRGSAEQARRTPRAALIYGVPVIVIAVGAIGFAAMRKPPPPPAPIVSVTKAEPLIVDATVSEVSWKRVVNVSRFHVVTQEGFAEKKPADAFDVRSLGSRIHHTEQVQVGTHDEHYTERVQDGFTSESYSERVQDGFDTKTTTTQVQCGQDCTERPKSCTRNCTSNKNGFATCSDVCTGGGQTCTPRYCPRTDTTQVPRYRDVSRTRQVPRYVDAPRTRRVPTYEDQPRYAPYFQWKAWDWEIVRTVEKTGSSLELVWPTDAELAPDGGLHKGEKEELSRSETFRAVLDASGQRYTVTPTDEAAFLALEPGTVHRIRRTDGALIP